MTGWHQLVEGSERPGERFWAGKVDLLKRRCDGVDDIFVGLRVF